MKKHVLSDSARKITAVPGHITPHTKKTKRVALGMRTHASHMLGFNTRKKHFKFVCDPI